MKIVLLDKCTITKGDLDYKSIDALGEVRYFDELSQTEIIDACADADAVLCNRAKMNAEIFMRCPRLKYVGLFATGFNIVNIADADKYGIAVCNVPNYSTDCVSQHAMALILNHANSVRQYIQAVKEGKWNLTSSLTSFDYPFFELNGLTLGIFGYGNIGKRMAKLASAFDMRVIVCTRTQPKDCPFELVNRNRLFEQSDFLSLHAPFSEQTANLVNKESLSQMKPSAVIINTSRGGLVNERELADALNNGIVSAAYLDVLVKEPADAANPLLTAKNCFITPHVAWTGIKTRQKLIELVANNLKNYFDGHPINVVNNPRERDQ
ncbi:MAG: D-2-hydroxyacid dehydrogenase [Clostridia bacterium]|nr:D-2-hydroxyacid dehydrogenase [Clostridia bacterium]